MKIIRKNGLSNRKLANVKTDNVKSKFVFRNESKRIKMYIL